MPKPALVISTRVASGVIGIAVAAAAVAGAALLPLPTLAWDPESLSVTPVPTSKRLVCPGSVLRLGDIGGGNASTAVALGRPQVVTAASNGTAQTAVLQASDADSATGAPILVSTGAGSADEGVMVAGAQHQVVDEGDYRGLAVAECAAPSSDSWLVGGSTAVGRTTLLTIANPGAVASTVAIEIASEDGLVEAPGLTGIVVNAGSQRTLSLAGFAPDLAAIAVHVTSRGGPVVANLQESIVRGIEPGGVDIVGTTAVAATQTVIPGLLVLDAEAVSGRLGEEGFDDLGTALRVYVPGTASAEATVRILPETADLVGGSFELVLEPGIVTDVPIEGLLDGAYSVLVETSVPVVAAVRASTVASENVGDTPAGASDVGWFAAATSISGSAFASIAPGPGATLHLVNPGDLAATVRINDETVTVPAGSGVAVEVVGGLSYRIDGAEGLFASVSVGAPGQLAGYLVSSASATEAPVVIYP